MQQLCGEGFGIAHPAPGQCMGCSEKCCCGMLLCNGAGRKEVKSHKGAARERAKELWRPPPLAKAKEGGVIFFSCHVPKQ